MMLEIEDLDEAEVGFYSIELTLFDGNNTVSDFGTIRVFEDI